MKHAFVRPTYVHIIRCMLIIPQQQTNLSTNLAALETIPTYLKQQYKMADKLAIHQEHTNVR